MAKLKPIKDQVMVIAGAGSGIGLATARAAARAGARVMLVASNDAATGEIVRAINNGGGRADYAVADGGDAAALSAAAKATVARFGRIDTWVNAGFGEAAEPPELDIEEQQLFQTAYFGVVHGCQAGVPMLRQAGGALITIGSGAAGGAGPLAGLDAAVTAYVDALRVDLARQAPAISVLLIAPPTDDLDRAAATVLAGAAGGGRAAGVYGAAARRPGLVAAVGLGGLALVAGGIAALRRRRRA